MFQLVSTFQEAACRISSAAHPRDACLRAIKRTPPPRTRLEELIVYGLLFETAVRAVRGARTSSRLKAQQGVNLLFSGTTTTRANRERTNALRAAQTIVGQYRNPCGVPKLARAARCHETTLRRAFRKSIGMSIREFHVRVRICEAVREFAAGTRDVLAVARSVGYRSEKNFYRAVSKYTGLTPAELREAKLPCASPTCGRVCGSDGAMPLATWCRVHRIGERRT